MSTISIIGSGGMAAAVGARAAKAGHTVEVVSRDPAKARALAEKLGGGAMRARTAQSPQAISSSSPCRTPVRPPW